eukprot:CAMPEP_0115506162 /NCGR_PEP_ID=MMETSP0271-20121206/70994_1 /TAXON_ID=71861 /ORGANISM="Scrippsiella trochoidea, Strain CCMP3099" /LENGTH=247 /DNA_ID=CAMNT_0002935565 /DNA_START=37 /DNA_END=780 /DNA_ORIENTATION=-
MSAAPMELCIDLGPMVVEQDGGIMTGLRNLWEKNELCDVELIAGGQTFQAHRLVLAAVSSSFHECLVRLSAEVGSVPAAMAAKEKLVMRLDDITHPEAVQAMLNCIYEPQFGTANRYNPSSHDANRDVLRLAQRFQISQLLDLASRWLASNLSTSNVLERLSACEEFGLGEVREKIFEQLTANPSALFVLAQDAEIIKMPIVLQDLLVRVLKLLGCGNEAAPPKGLGLCQSQGKAHQQGKTARKAGA